MANRKHPPHPYEHRLWRAGYAWSSFGHVKDVCDYILNEHIQPDDTIYYSLMTSICVLYARPFKRSKGIESLTLQFVPKEFHHLHDQLIMMRDQTVAHVDTRGAHFHGLPANSVRLIVRGTQVALGVQQLKFKTTTISEIRELASTLVERLLRHIQKLARENPNDALDDGEYLIDLTTRTFRRL